MNPFAMLATFLLVVGGAALVRPAASGAAPVAYPQALCSTITLNATTFRAGETLSVSGDAFTPDTDIRLVLEKVGSKTVLTSQVVHSNASGDFFATFLAPQTTGNYRIVAANGFSTAGQCPPDPGAGFRVQIGGENNTAPDNGDHGGTAFTGVDIAVLLLVALALIVVGAVLTARGRRRTARR